MFKPSSIVAWCAVLACGWAGYQYVHNWRNPWAIQAPNFPQKTGCTKDCL